MKHIFPLSALLALLMCSASDGFILQSRPQTTLALRRNHLRCILFSTSTSHLEDRGTSGLRFNASVSYKSRDVPMPKSPKQFDELRRFFSTDDTNYYLLAKGTKNEVTEASKHSSSMYMCHWTEEARKMGSEIPNVGDKLLSLSVRTPFLVFVLKITALLGVKLLWRSHLQSNDDGNHEEVKLPEYQMVLLDQTFSAEGPRPLVFLFNHFTGINRTVKGTYEQPHHALFTVKAIPSKDFNRLSFVSRMTAELNIRFPAVLLKLLPVPKEKIEKEGSDNLKKNMEKDVPPGVNLFKNAYVDWLRTLEI